MKYRLKSKIKGKNHFSFEYTWEEAKAAQSKMKNLGIKSIIVDSTGSAV